ncbi:MAG: rhodanese-like domain-containing protein, partial [Bacteroidota bacterium]
MKCLISLFLFLCCSCYTFSQGHCINPAFDKKVEQSINASVPTIDVDHLRNNIADFYIIDTREFEEFNLSHIPGAHFMSYKNPDFSILNQISKQFQTEISADNRKTAAVFFVYEGNCNVSNLISLNTAKELDLLYVNS